ncbi:Hypothetical protein MVR_LOCUS368 [uncultured virus]|nr:Hypothetical protein MVR_LOCUS368 [uncultured virus]
MLCFAKDDQYHVYITLNTFRECKGISVSSSLEWTFDDKVRMSRLTLVRSLDPEIVRKNMSSDSVFRVLYKTKTQYLHWPKFIDRVEANCKDARVSILGWKVLSRLPISGWYTINEPVTNQTTVSETNPHPSQVTVPIELSSVTIEPNTKDTIIDQLNTKIKALEQQLASETAQRNYNKHFIARLMQFICQPPTDEERMKATGVIGMMYNKMPIAHDLDLADYLDNMCEFRDSL